jgi:hypothetical protein
LTIAAPMGYCPVMEVDTMDIRRLSPLVLAALLGSAVACTDKSEDTSTDESDADADADSDADADADADVLEADFMLVTAEFGLMDGQLGGVTFDGSDAGAYFIISIINSELWEGTSEDEVNGCYLYYDMVGNSTLDPLFNDAGAWQGWMIDAPTAYIGNGGACDDLDPSGDWGDDVVAWAESFQWGIGVGPTSEEMDTNLADIYGDDYELYAANFYAGILATDFGSPGELGVQEFDYGIIFSVDEAGEVISDADGNGVFYDVTDLDYAPDGFYRLLPYFGMRL